MNEGNDARAYSNGISKYRYTGTFAVEQITVRNMEAIIEKDIKRNHENKIDSR